ncbi:PAS domain S-box protein [Singulisphaera acidiphila]|uniref:histidine kinase n=1 Tax=Singulisphaera acidiphila (strain ATCC BAA-1392 / DSM 18658 / VKM B-2454 / MOB10) TaxID=886293 RepID=L0D8D5_SINAD|nr:PAS domain S-box protein [Singulisphaera acidiphila]AGA25492.1 PAS domain S-box [Singulisphaera acidiphila DSM 18658]
MSEPAMLADHIDEQSEAILAVWRATVERDGDAPEVGRLSRAEFNDHIPDLLERLGDRLRGRPSNLTVEGKLHGTDRWSRGYNIAEVVVEFGHLRTALTRATLEFAHQHQWNLAQLNAAFESINEVLDEATSVSVRQFQEASRAETQKALSEVKKRQNAIEDAWIAAKLEKSKLRTILNSLPLAVWVVDAEGTVIGVNEEAERLSIFAQKADVGRTNVYQLGSENQILRPDGTPFPLEELSILRALHGESASQEELIWVIQGEARTVSIKSAPLTDAVGAILGAVAVVQDITGRRLAEEQLRRERDFSRTITETLAEGLSTFDLNGRITFVNPAALQMLGWTGEELLGKNIHETIHDERPDRTRDPAEEHPILGVLHTGLTAQGDEVFVRKDGSKFFVAYTASPIISSGRIVGVAQAFRDITERKRLEARLATSEAQFRTIAEKSPVMIWRTDVEGQCDYVNQTWLDFRGGCGSHLDLGEHWASAVHPDDLELFQNSYREAFARREPFEVTYRLRRSDGQFRWISDRGTPYADAQGTFLGYLGSCLDITERINLETSLEQQRELAEEGSRHKTRLVSALSHDARTPLNAVVLAAQLLEIHFDGGADAEVQTCLRTIRHSVRNVLDLLGDLLNLSKIDAGALPAEISRFPLEQVLAECVASIEPQARVKGLKVQLEPGSLAGHSLETDRSKLKQILSNLLSNALRYTEKGHIRIYGVLTDDQIRIAVEDSGIGIRLSDQGRIFDEFAILDNPQRAEGGTGLGLAICRRLASLLKGEITLRSTAGVGSTFTLVLPSSALTLNQPASDYDNSFESPASPFGAILVAEDHVDSRQTLARVLRRMGYRVLEASNGRDVLAVAKQERLLAVLMDVNMPLMDGIEATLALRADAQHQGLPIFALTGDVTLVNQHRIGEAGVNGYLEKPVTWEALKQALGTLGNRAEA